MNQAKILILTIFFILLTGFLGRYMFLGQAVYGDGRYYWAYVRSAVIDHDLSLENEAAHPFSPEHNNSFSENTQQTESLVYKKYYPIGTSFTWIPGFLLGHILSPLFSYPQNGYADSYQITVGVFNITLLTAGLMLVYLTLKIYYTRFVSVLSVILILFGTNLYYYGSLDVLNSHPTSFFVSSLIFYLLFTGKTHVNQRKLMLLGGLIGILTLIRPQDLLFSVLCIPLLFQKSVVKTIQNGVIFGGGIVLLYCLQLLASWNIHNSPFVLPYLTGTNTFDVFNPHILELFLSQKTGLIFYAPIYIVSIFGLVLNAKSGTRFSRVILFLLGLQLFVISTWSGWEQGESFGMRMLISLLPFLSLGLSAIITRLSRVFSKPALIGIGFVFILQNFLMIFLFHLFLHGETYIGTELSPGSKVRIILLEYLRPFF